MTENTNEYPLMLYLAGDPAQANVIVQDADEEKIAKKDGFVRVKTQDQLAKDREKAEADAEAARKAAEEAEAERLKAEAAKNQQGGGSR